jgi:hypothetical protein
MMTKSDLSLHLTAMSVLLALHVPVPGIVVYLLALLVASARDDRPRRPATLVAMRGNLKYKVRRAGHGKPVITGSTGASESGDGTFAQVEQRADRETKRYRKRVVLADGTVVKDYDGPLDDGHGGPRLAVARRTRGYSAWVPWWLELIRRVRRR